MIRIAIPEPTSSDAEYNSRSLPPYIAALRSAGAIPVIIPLHEVQERVARMLSGVQGVLLPGSKFDVEPERYGSVRTSKCGPSDGDRTAVDELMLQDGFNLGKPILAICHGLQTLNVWLNGSLIQDLETQIGTQVNHRPGPDVVCAHPIRISAGSRLATLLGSAIDDLETECNSSHHQAIDRLGDRLNMTAISPVDGVIEAVELVSRDHFVVGVQWHPERTLGVNALSRALFADFIRAGEAWRVAARVDQEQMS